MVTYHHKSYPLGVCNAAQSYLIVRRSYDIKVIFGYTPGESSPQAGYPAIPRGIPPVVYLGGGWGVTGLTQNWRD